MVSRRLFIATASGCAALLFAALYVLVRPQTVQRLIVPKVALKGSSLAYTVPSGWEDSDHSSCHQPCVRLRLVRGTNSGGPGPSITLQPVSAADRQSTPLAYAEAYVRELPELVIRTPAKRIRVGVHRAVEFRVLMEVIVDTVESFTRARSTTAQRAAHHVIFEVERRLYECVNEGAPDDVDAYETVLLAFCASVSET
jgi:hypothetical protein